jgi:site-specific recombinase XerD
MAFRRGRTYWSRVKNADGRRTRVSLGTTDRNIAAELEALVKRLASLRMWDVLTAAGQRPGGFGELLDHYRREGESLTIYRATIHDPDLNAYVPDWCAWAARGATAETVAKYERQLRSLFPEGKVYPCSRFRRRELSDALRRRNVSGSTARRIHAAWRSFGKYLVEIEVLDHNPLRDVQPPRENAGRQVFLDQAEQVRLVKAQPFPFSALAALREGAGVEISAALRVRRRDFSETERTVFVRGTKNEWRVRYAIVEAWAWPLLRRAFASKLPDALVFEGLTYAAARSEHRAALKATKIREDYRMHDSRHSLAVRWMKKGVAPEIIANNLGHRDASLVLRLYGRYRPRSEDLRRVREQVAL